MPDKPKAPSEKSSGAIDETYRVFLNAASEHFKVVDRAGFDDADKYCLISKEDAAYLLTWFESMRRRSPRSGWRSVPVDKKILKRLRQIKFPPIVPEPEEESDD